MREVLKELLPPDVPPVVRWRLAVACVCAGMLFFMGWAISPWGFARAGDMNNIQSDINDVKISQLEQALFSAKDSECTSPDPVARSFFRQRVLSLSRDYFRITGISANIPPCKDG